VRFGVETNGINDVPAVCLSIAVGFGSVWVVDCPTKTLSRFDTTSGALTATVALPIGAVQVNSMMSTGEGVVFLMSSGAKDNVILRIDPATKYGRCLDLGATWCPAPSVPARVQSGYPPRSPAVSASSTPKPE